MSPLQREKYKFDLDILKSSHVTSGSKSWRMQSPKEWNSLHYPSEVAEKFAIFKRFINCWEDGKLYTITFIIKVTKTVNELQTPYELEM